MISRVQQVLLGIAIALLVWRLTQFVGYNIQSLNYPFELDYGEGIVWQQASQIASLNAYGPIDGFPAIVFHYPPVYYILTIGVAAITGQDLLFAGRLVTMLCTYVSALFVGLLIRELCPAHVAPRLRALAAVAGALTVFACWPVVAWGQVMRVDMAGYMFGLIGLYAGVRAYRNPHFIWLASVCFVCAVFGKQTAIAASASYFAVTLWLRPRLAVKGIAICVVLGLMVLAGLAWATDWGALRHLFLYNVNRWDIGNGRLLWKTAYRLVPLILVALGFLIYQRKALQRLVDEPRGQAGHFGDFERTNILLAFVGMGGVMSCLIIKSGATFNYVLEAVFALTILVGVALAMVLNAAQANPNTLGGRLRPFALLAVPLLIGVQTFIPASNHVLAVPATANKAELAALVEVLRRADKPVISDDMVLIKRAGKDVVWESAIFAELATLGRWDERPFVARIERGEFAMFITFKQRGNRLFDSRYTKTVADAIDKAYPVKRQITTGRTLHLPAEGQ